MKRDLTYWRWVYRTSGGWRGVRWCLNCLYGPRAWKLIVLNWWRVRLFRKSFKRMAPAEREEILSVLRELASKPN